MTRHQSFPLHALQTEILEALVMGERFESISNLLCQRAEELAPGTICSILAITHDGKLKPVAAPSLPQHYSDALNGIAIGPTVGSCGTSAYYGTPIEVEDISTDPLWAPYKELALPLGLMACWSSPIKTRDGRVAATFAFYYSTKRGPNVLESSIVQTCVHLCAIAIEHDEAQRRNHDLAYYDQLTGLPNRRCFDDMMSHRIISEDPAFGLLIVDIDNLKIVNDTMGHVVGDSLIQEVARRFFSIVPDASCRLGGDEFAVLVDHCRDHAALNMIADEIAQTMKVPLECGGYVPFEQGLRTSIALRMSTIREVDEALNAGLVLPHYQPIVEMDTREIVGLEALARIKREDDSIISAGQFQAALSDPSAAFRLTDRMLKLVASDMRIWMDKGIAIDHVGINLSTTDFHRNDLEQRLSDVFDAAGVPLKHLLLEVTETVLMDGNDDKVAQAIKRLRRKGMLVALDDFGTGYASLTHLLSFPVDIIKIDKSFIDRMLSDC